MATLLSACHCSPSILLELSYESLIPKSVEHHLLELVQTKELSLESSTQYKVLFRPSVFKPGPAEPPAPAKPMSKQEARGMVIGGGLLTIILGGLTTYLGLHKTWWALLPGFFCLGPLQILFMGLSGWLAAIRRYKKSPDAEMLDEES